MHEALSEEERESLPAFNDTEMMARLHTNIIEAVFEDEVDPERVQRIDRACQRWLAPSLAIAPVLAVCLLMWLFADSPKLFSFQSTVASLSSAAGFTVDTANSRTLEAADLPMGCLTLLGQKSDGDASLCLQCHRESPTKVAPIDKSHYECCTTCHSAEKHTAKVTNNPKFAASCGSCHVIRE